MVIEIALSDPQFYGRELLVYGVLRIEKSDSESQESDTNIDENNENDKIINALAVFLKKQHKLDRLALLIAEFLEHNSLNKVVDDFFGSLIQRWKKPEVLLSILKRLRYDANVSQIFWLKRIFSEVPEERFDIRKDANRFLINLGKKKNNEIFELLKEVKEWWSSNDKELSNNNHNIYGLTFLYHYSVSSVYSLQKEAYGSFPSRYFLFANFVDLGSAEVTEKIAFLAEWLFHPSLNGLSYNHNYEFDLFEIRTNADLIEHWALILLGNRKNEKPDSNTKELLKMILKQVRESIDKATQRNIRSAWSQKSQYYLKLGATISSQEQFKRKLLIFRRNNLKKIIKYFDNQ
ncbi:hypothetical protein [Psychroserpens sp.]